MKSIKYKNKIIAYTINKAKVDNLYITIQDGEVAIKAPWYLSTNQIQKALEEKREWILQKLEEYNNSPRAIKKYIDGERFKLLGQDYYLQIKYTNVKQAKLILEDGMILINFPTKFKGLNNKTQIKCLVEKMYEKVAEKEIELAMEKVRVMTKLAPEDYKVKKLIRTWGNCSSTKKITLNVDLVKYSKKAIEYVVLHEVCHLKYMSHSKKFWDMLKSYMPDYKQIEKELKI